MKVITLTLLISLTPRSSLFESSSECSFLCFSWSIWNISWHLLRFFCSYSVAEASPSLHSCCPLHLRKVNHCWLTYNAWVPVHHWGCLTTGRIEKLKRHCVFSSFIFTCFIFFAYCTMYLWSTLSPCLDTCYINEQVKLDPHCSLKLQYDMWIAVF